MAAVADGFVIDAGRAFAFQVREKIVTVAAGDHGGGDAGFAQVGHGAVEAQGAAEILAVEDLQPAVFGVGVGGAGFRFLVGDGGLPDVAAGEMQILDAGEVVDFFVDVVQGMFAHADDVAILEQVFVDALLVDEGALFAAQIHQYRGLILCVDAGVFGGQGQAVDVQVTGGIMTDEHLPAQDGVDLEYLAFERKGELRHAGVCSEKVDIFRMIIDFYSSNHQTGGRRPCRSSAYSSRWSDCAAGGAVSAAGSARSPCQAGS